MDDLLKRQNQAAAGGFEPESLQGGDLSGGDGLQSKGLENDIGSGLELERGLVKRDADWKTSQNNVFVCGDMGRGQSLIVWAISERITLNASAPLTVYRHVNKNGGNVPEFIVQGGITITLN